MLERILLRERLIVLAAITLICLLAWGYLLEMYLAMHRQAGMTSMSGMPGMSETATTPTWSLTKGVLMFWMWLVMMAGMMLPSATPMILLFDKVNRQQNPQPTYLATAFFCATYLLCWGLFSLLATVLQWQLEQSLLLSPMMASQNQLLGAGLFMLAGLYQLTPLKRACLAHCHSPLFFIQQHWRNGHAGALRMGIRHGSYCLGCCWALMLLLFVAGVMNLLWVAALSLFVLFEKLFSTGESFSRLSGLGMLLAGLGLLWL